MANMTDLQVRIVGRACITRFDAGEAPTLSGVIANNYAVLNNPEREEDLNAIVAFIVSERPDIPL
ncbi:hypothetical protein ACHHV8_10115 [Paenibacillus sp. TAB 01]|uniref:hypothetical protein n=1 Tax=Paenibacillus sp. TAB 01 TaxID=3368988 RepID=UPI00375330A7